MVVLALLACGMVPPDEVTLSLALQNTSAPGAIVASDDSTHDVKFGPAALIVHHPAIVPLALTGEAPPELESLAEDGSPQALVDALEGGEGIAYVGVWAREDQETYEDAPLLPGQSIEKVVTAPPDAVITLVFMFGESNDVFYANAEPIPLWVDGDPNVGDLTAALSLWDAGTEVNQEPGLGADQAPRQAGPDQGADEGGEITAIDGADAAGFVYPDVSDSVVFEAVAPEPND